MLPPARAAPRSSAISLVFMTYLLVINRPGLSWLRADYAAHAEPRLNEKSYLNQQHKSHVIGLFRFFRGGLRERANWQIDWCGITTDAGRRAYKAALESAAAVRLYRYGLCPYVSG